MVLERDPQGILAAHEAWCRAGQPWWGRAGTVANADLRGADLSNRQLVRVRLVRVDLRNANLKGTTLSMAKLEDVRLEGARLVGSNWHLAELDRVNLAGADLTRANLSSGRFRHGQAEAAILRDANLVKSFWDDWDVTRADFTGSNAIRAEFRNTRLTGSNWTRTRHVKSMFDGCDLRDVCLAEATLEHVSVIRSRVAGMHGPVAELQRLSTRDLDDGTQDAGSPAAREERLVARLRGAGSGP
jgi:uncharacterized protein YjbI with pentapeptide repeats